MCLPNSKLSLVEPEEYHGLIPKYDVESYISAKEKYKWLYFEKYVNLLISYPDRFLDIVLIDGRVSAAGIPYTINKVQHGGLSNVRQF